MAGSSARRRFTTRDGEERVFCATALSLVVFGFAIVSPAPTELPSLCDAIK
ncbi:MAG: hypothetical protein IPJ25_11560 [Rhodocyclaceae bacterium]|nr:hypothetical protein [Rhodocyclaceae bacterium]MBL0076217.1 hypothetical protein [Rhodocyclaceae bacterium]